MWSPRNSTRFLLPSLAAALSLLWIATPVARAEPAIEGVWSFNGGKIAIQGDQPGRFVGTVVAPTKFSLCTHPVGEEIWTQMVQQPDGSYWGLHRWYFESSDCVINPAPGKTAWRVLQSAQGRYLRVCFSEPGSGLQPTIAASGKVTDATFGCIDSALLSAVPDVSSAKLSRYVGFPTAKTCLKRRTLRIRIRDPKNDPIQKIVVRASGGGISRKAHISQRKRGAVAIVHLGGFPADSVITVRLWLTTVLGQHLSGKRRYKRCGGGKQHRRFPPPSHASGLGG
jgi:hypothetical protein